MFFSGVGGLTVAPAPVGVLLLEMIPDLSRDWKSDETSGTAGAAFGEEMGGALRDGSRRLATIRDSTLRSLAGSRFETFGTYAAKPKT